MAPSGDNCQPWRFEVGPGFIDLYNVPERDYSLYNWGQRPSYIANGAVLENMAIAAAAKGYRLTIKVLPDSGTPELVARTYVERSGDSTHPLYDAIWKRVTNRKKYHAVPLSAEHLERLERTTSNGQRLLFITDTPRRSKLASLAALNERILFEDRRMHSFFFSHINWNDQQDRERKFGFLLKTFELPPLVQAGCAVLKHYPALQALNAIGLSNILTKMNSGIYATGAAIGAIVIPSRDINHYVGVGRLLERVWLTATSLGLHLHPLPGVALLMNRIADGDASLSRGHAQLVSGAYGEMCKTVRVSDGVIALLFRIGHANPPTARTTRLKPDIRMVSSA